MIKTAVITNSFNRLSLLKLAAEPIVRLLQQDESIAWVIFDAGSTDGSLDFINDLIQTRDDSRIKLISPRDSQSTSFAAGCNQAIEFALNNYSSLEWCLFYETDNQLLNATALSDGRKRLESDESLAGVGFNLEAADGQHVCFGCNFPRAIEFVLGQTASAKLRLDKLQVNWIQNSSGPSWTYCDVVFTSPLLIRAAAWRDVGPMDAIEFPFTDSDLDWAWRARAKGWRLAAIDVPGVIHDNVGAISQWSSRRVLWFHQSRYRLLKRHRGRCIRTVLPLLLLRHSIEYLIIRLASRNRAEQINKLNTRKKLLLDALSGYAHVVGN